MTAPSSTPAVRAQPTGYHQRLTRGLPAASPEGGVLGCDRRQATTRCRAAKPVRIRHSPATVTIRPTRARWKSGRRPAVLLDLREKAARGLRSQFDRHVKIARWTLPIWLYVSVTGVVIYLMLYQMYVDSPEPRCDGPGAATTIRRWLTNQTP